MAPIDGIRFVHAAIVEEARELETLAAAACEPADLERLVERLEFFAELLDGHTRGEEAGLFPPIAARQPNFADTYLLDHADEAALIGRILSLGRACSAGNEGSLSALRRETVALSCFADAHVRKENTLVLPLCRDLFSDDEQAEMVATMLGAFSPNVMGRAASWIVSRVDPDTGAEYLGELRAAMPADVFAGTVAAVRGAVGEEAWSHLVARLPGMG